jgi:hypothetical protein
MSGWWAYAIRDPAQVPITLSFFQEQAIRTRAFEAVAQHYRAWLSNAGKDHKYAGDSNGSCENTRSSHLAGCSHVPLPPTLSTGLVCTLISQDRSPLIPHILVFLRVPECSVVGLVLYSNILENTRIVAAGLHEVL